MIYICREEIFGFVVFFLLFKIEEDVIYMVNDINVGLFYDCGFCSLVVYLFNKLFCLIFVVFVVGYIIL